MTSGVPHPPPPRQERQLVVKNQAPADRPPAPTLAFRTTLLAGGKTATGIAVPDEVIEALGHGRRPPVRVTINGHSYRSTVAVMGGVSMIGVSAENRALTGTAAGDEIEVMLTLDTTPRVVAVPDDLAAALAAEPPARHAFEALSNSRKRWHVDSVTGAKTAETRQRRIERSVAALLAGPDR